jgi:hypothetical protein
VKSIVLDTDITVQYDSDDTEYGIRKGRNVLLTCTSGSSGTCQVISSVNFVFHSYLLFCCFASIISLCHTQYSSNNFYLTTVL